MTFLAPVPYFNLKTANKHVGKMGSRINLDAHHEFAAPDCYYHFLRILKVKISVLQPQNDRCC